MTRKRKKFESVSAYPLDWPTGYPRAKKRKRSLFKTSLADARDGLLEELRLMRAKNVVISTNVQTYEKKGKQVPYSGQATPSDPGAAVYFEWKKESYVLACDRWKTVDDNMQALRKTVEALRGLERWGVSDMLRRTVSGFKRLPEAGSGRPWWAELGLGPSASKGEIQQAFRRRAANAHPDAGGDLGDWHRLQEARRQGLAARSGRDHTPGTPA